MKKNLRTITLPPNIRFSPEDLCSLLKEKGFIFEVEPHLLKKPKRVSISSDGMATFEQWDDDLPRTPSGAVILDF